ncbi:MAG: hypothetical protein HOD90_00470 [Nitrospina sp.]|nr:hypothetical protein [Nitrospina sp.]
MASQILDIICSECGTFILRYKKKGSGQLIKLYLDRVVESSSFSRLNFIFKKKGFPILSCKNCGKQIGFAYERGVYRMIKGSFRRKAVK